LSLSKKLAGVLGGDVGAESEPGVGSRFSVTIPLWLPGHEHDGAGDGKGHGGNAAGEATDVG
jgi:hypothetical protein